AQAGAPGRHAALRLYASRVTRFTHVRRSRDSTLSVRTQEPARRDGTVTDHDPDAAPAAVTGDSHIAPANLRTLGRANADGLIHLAVHWFGRTSCRQPLRRQLAPRPHGITPRFPSFVGGDCRFGLAVSYPQVATRATAARGNA